MSKITAQNMIDECFIAEMFNLLSDDEVIGSDDLNYTCIAPHLSASGNKPSSGTWQAYWVQKGSKGEDWVTDTVYQALFSDFLNKIISEQSPILEGKLGSTKYNSVTSPEKDNVIRAEVCLVASELLRRRINIILGSVKGNGQEIDVSQEINQRQNYLNELDVLVENIVSGTIVETSGNDFSTEVVESSHF